jgi:hypothetical protein
VAEKWRVVIVLDDAAGVGWFGLRRRKHDLAREMQDRTGAVVVGAGDPGQSPVSVYTGDREAAEAAAQVAREFTGQHGPAARVTVECWRPVQGRWEDASAVSQHDLDEERDYQQREDRLLSAESGVAQWRVRVELRTHSDAVVLAQRLSNDGLHVDQRWKTVVAGADSEGDAERLAEKIRQYATADADVFAERADTLEWSAPFIGPYGDGPFR